MRNDRERLLDILEAISRIEKYADRGRSALEHDELVQTWVIHHLEIVGEAARGLSREFTDRHTEVSWQSIVGMRNVLVHQYFGIDVDAVWLAVERDMPELKRKIAGILAILGRAPKHAP